MADNHAVSVYGTRYLDSEPCYLTTERGQFVFDRVKNRWLDWSTLAAKAAAEGHTWQSREVGIPSIRWQLLNSRLIGQFWAPGLDDTSGLASEKISNGDTWTGASGTTPPTGWDIVGAATTFTVYGGQILDIVGDGSAKFMGMSQDITTEVGVVQVMEILITLDSGAEGYFGVDGIRLPLPDVPDGQNSRVIAVSFDPTGTTHTVEIGVLGAGNVAVDHVRVFNEKELTGGGKPTGTGGGGGGGGPTPEPDFVVMGPYVAYETTFFIQKFREDLNMECKVWLDVDADPDPDVALTKMQVCESEISDRVKMAINAQLEADGCGGLPCVTQAGNLQKAYTHAVLYPEPEPDEGVSEK